MDMDPDRESAHPWFDESVALPPDFWWVMYENFRRKPALTLAIEAGLGGDELRPFLVDR
jgi:hypothetical protein